MAMLDMAPRRRGPTFGYGAVTCAFLALAAACALVADLHVAALHPWADLLAFGAGFLRPDLAAITLNAIVLTVAFAVVGVGLGACVGLALSLVFARSRAVRVLGRRHALDPRAFLGAAAAADHRHLRHDRRARSGDPLCRDLRQGLRRDHGGGRPLGRAGAAVRHDDAGAFRLRARAAALAGVSLLPSLSAGVRHALDADPGLHRCADHRLRSRDLLQPGGLPPGRGVDPRLLRADRHARPVGEAEDAALPRRRQPDRPGDDGDIAHRRPHRRQASAVRRRHRSQAAARPYGTVLAVAVGTSSAIRSLPV